MNKMTIASPFKKNGSLQDAQKGDSFPLKQMGSLQDKKKMAFFKTNKMAIVSPFKKKTVSSRCTKWR